MPLAAAILAVSLPMAGVEGDAQRATQAADPLAPVRACVPLTAGEAQAIRGGSPLVRTLPAGGFDVTVVGISRINADGDRLLAWVREIDQLKRSDRVTEIGRFSDPPRREDLAGLSLSSDELSILRRCRPGDCDMKLSARERERIQAERTAHGDSRSAIESTFQDLLLDRVRVASIPADQPDETGGLLAWGRCFTDQVPGLSRALASGRPASGIESFFYWSREDFGGKPVIRLTRVVMGHGLSGGPGGALVAGRQILTTHYLDDSLNLTALVGGTDGEPAYLVVLNRTRVDVIHGLMGGLIRAILEYRLRGELEDVIRGLAHRLESGVPVRKTVTP
jgi:hypothetical protein